ncbi:signal recognition particle receptor FtsY [Oscillospiraceae bacterium]|uniref:signal recognition particle-docking protein FtsY n=1 Tax=Allofournierella sp. TaxID=1940256 RepID=UPI0015B2B295|nr:signal recognition particle receptor FtsY [Oscillospiraceae bacterium]
MGLFSRKEKMDEGLAKTRKGFFAGILDMMNAGEIDDSFYDDLEEQLILADTGADEAARLVEALREAVRRRHIKTADDAIAALKEIICAELEPEGALDLAGRPAVILVIGVNGVGKTTSIAKLAKLYKEQGKRVLLAAGDTFRAAAAEQLSIWAERVEVPIVKHSEGADPAAVVFDAVQSAAARGYDLVICDTAGRLHNKQNLMNELTKISRSVTKACPEASVETLLVLDAITGQNAISQAAQFISAAGATGIILTKLDGTAKGGAVISVKQKLGLPVRFVGVGEGMDDLMEFSAEDFADALFAEA